MVIDCLNAYGRVDVLVNCAGIVHEVPFLEMATTDWDTMMEVDLRSVFLCSRAVAQPMVGQGWGRIINLASQLGIKGGTNVAHYVAAKAGVIGFTKALARESLPQVFWSTRLPRGRSRPLSSATSATSGGDQRRRSCHSGGSVSQAKSPPPPCFWRATLAATYSWDRCSVRTQAT